MAKSSVITEEFRAIQIALEALEPLSESQRVFAATMVLARLEIKPSSLSVNAGGAGGNGGGAGTPSGGGGSGDSLNSITAKEFLKQKGPTTDLERMICLAYYLANARDVVHFKTVDITSLNTEAAGPRFSNATTTANNAVNQSGYFSHAGSGKKQLTPLGEDVVRAMPDREAMAAVIAAAPKKRKGKSKARTKGKSKGKA